MEKIKKFVNELKKTLDYSEEITVFYEEYEEPLYKIYICNAEILFSRTINILAKWNIEELRRNRKGDYEIIIAL